MKNFLVGTRKKIFLPEILAMLPAIDWYLDRPILQGWGWLKSQNSKNPLLVNFFFLSFHVISGTQKSFFTKMFLIVLRWKIYGFRNFLKQLGVPKIEKIAKNVDFWHIFNFLSRFSVFSRQTVKEKVVPHGKCQHFDTLTSRYTNFYQ